MKFFVTRTSTWDEKPCDEATSEVVPFFRDYRTVRTLEEAAQQSFWFKDWKNRGVNHREDAERGMVVCDVMEPREHWVVELSGLEELLAFCQKHGDVIVTQTNPSKSHHLPWSLEIYDGYRE